MQCILVAIWRDNFAKCGHLTNFVNSTKFGYITKSFLYTVQLQMYTIRITNLLSFNWYNFSRIYIYTVL